MIKDEIKFQSNLDRLKKTTECPSSLDDLIVVGFYTVDTPYESEAQKTIDSCKKLKINYYFSGVRNFGNWQKNTRYKSTFLRECLDKFDGYRLLYIDCDAIINSKPVLFEDYKCDISVRWQDFSWRKNECLSGTIYLEPNDNTRSLCDIWINDNIKNENDDSTLEQWNLGNLIKKLSDSGNLIHKNLPPEYTFIFDHMKRIYPEINPIIEHFQASRQNRRKI